MRRNTILRMRSWVSCLVLLAVVFSVSPDAVGEKYEFIPEAPASLQEVLDAELMTNMKDGAFHPEQRMSRAELATVLDKTFDLDSRPASRSIDSITDVKPDYWAYGSIEKVVSRGIMSGYREGRFYPEQKITRAEGFAIFAQAFGVYSFKESTIDETLGHYSDQSQIPKWARKAMATAASEGFINTNNGQLRPMEPMTRGDMAYALSWWLGRKKRYSPSKGL